jgi:hypothetical protein
MISVNGDSFGESGAPDIQVLENTPLRTGLQMLPKCLQPFPSTTVL